MSACSCENLNHGDDRFINVTCLKCTKNDVLDSWHYTGSKLFHSDDVSKNFLEFCKSKLKKKDLPITIGWTGYVNANKNIFSLENSWCTDELGRIVILIDKHLLFQRYTNGDIIMISSDGISYEQITGKVIESIMLHLSNK